MAARTMQGPRRSKPARPEGVAKALRAGQERCQVAVEEEGAERRAGVCGEEPCLQGAQRSAGK